MRYTVKNIYGIAGTSTHKTPDAAIKAAGRHEGAGWIVEDGQGNQWDRNGPDAPEIVKRAGE